MTDEQREEAAQQSREEEADRLLEEASLSNMGTMGAGTWELYSGLREGGFTQLEALWLIGYMLTQGSEKLGEEDDPPV